MPTPEIQSVIKNPTLNLSLDQEKNLIDNQAELLEEAMQMTVEDLNKLKDKITSEKNDQEVPEAEIEAKFNTLIQEIDNLLESKKAQLSSDPTQAPSLPPTTVDDIVQEKTEGDKTLFDQITDFFQSATGGTTGWIINQWINIRRTLGDLGIWAVDAKADAGLEKLYGRFFGASEVRKRFEQFFSDKNISISIVAGKKDASAYAKIRALHKKKIADEAAGLSGIDPADAASMVPWESYLDEMIENYSKMDEVKAITDSGTSTTTISAIVDGKLPSIDTEVQDPPATPATPPAPPSN
jgi:hypothetical protein